MNLWCIKHRARLVFFAIICADIAAMLLVFSVSLLLRFDGIPLRQIYNGYVRTHLTTIPFTIVIYLFAFSLFRLYKYDWRFAGLETARSVVYANSIGIFGIIAFQKAICGYIYPKSLLAIIWITSVLAIGCVRIFLRVIYRAKQRNLRRSIVTPDNPAVKRAVILGAGAVGARIVNAINNDPSLKYNIIGFLDDDPSKMGTYIYNVKVIGSVAYLKYLMENNAIDEVIVALPQNTGAMLREYVIDCRMRKLPIKIVPYIRDFLSGRKQVNFVDFSVEDLLRRTPMNIDTSQIGGYLKGKRILVTGAGGSIGSELCRQIISQAPSSLILLGHGENSIHQIYQEMKREYPEESKCIHCAIASVANDCRIKQIFSCYHPQVVFHAAAHKHVPLMESNEQEAVHNNVFGTNNIANACGYFGIEKMVLMSTDKAVDPCNIMGVTKWMCEEILRAMVPIWPKTSFITVRFGNVLGSRGSAVPIFSEQIRCGGPITITHPEMARFFMTIPEAVHLVLDAGTIGHSGELYILNMGDQIKITDIAKDMIRLCGLEPGVDIAIEYTGLRPGERLQEQLISTCESIKPSMRDDLSIVERPEYFTSAQFINIIRQLENVIDSGSANEIRNILNELLPGKRNIEANLVSTAH